MQMKAFARPTAKLHEKVKRALHLVLVSTKLFNHTSEDESLQL
jgi:hypothetical protein